MWSRERRVAGLSCVVCVAALSTGTAAYAADAARYPERPVRLVLGFAPGGTADTIARILTPKLHEALGRPWVIDNRAGASGNIATEIVAKANPDAHTVLLALSTQLTVSPLLYKLPVDVQTGLKPVILMATAQYMLVAHPSIKVSTVKELIALAKTQSGKLNYASAGVGSPHHLAAELFKTRAGVEMTHVAYKGGGPASAAVLGNEVQVLFGSLPSLLSHVRSGRLRALGLTGTSRSAELPDVPPIAEAGLPGFDVASWFGLLVAGRTPDAVAQRLHDTTATILKMPDVQEAIRRQGLEVATKGPKEFRAFINAETAVWAKVIKAANIRLD
jgi:tripartite-type tricarboxylate transporter receptor subunit TctC